MPGGLKTYLNRCRCCLETFFENESISEISSFFGHQFQAFTQMELSESGMLSKHVCEFCHSELLRFSVFKKDLIEKQQRLNDLLKQYEEKQAKHVKQNKAHEPITSLKVIEISDDEMLSGSGQEDDDEMDEDQDEDLTTEESDDDDEKDQDFLIVSALPKKSPITVNKKPKAPFIRSITPEPTQFTCDFCYMSFKAKQGLTRHVQSHIECSTPWVCGEDGCSFAASSKIKLNLHKLNEHDIAIPLTKADHIPERKTSEVKLKGGRGIGFTCFCGVSFETLMSLRAHKNRLHGRKNKCIYGCDNVQYVKSGHFLRHVQSKHPEKLEECLKLSPVTRTTQLLSGTEWMHCDKCRFKTQKKASLKSHMESHLPYDHREKFECQTCNKLFTRATSLRVHRITVHDKIRRFKCPNCPHVAFKQLGHLNDHLAFKHGKDGQFKCTLCKRFFLKRYMLNKHQRMTHKVDPHSLHLVKTQIINPKTVKTVVNNVPAQPRIQRRFKCFCGKSFPYKSRLTKHQLTHDEIDLQKEFICPTPGCNHSFMQRCNLVRHQKEKNHFEPEEQKQLFVCVCGQRFFTQRGFGVHADKKKCKRSKKPKTETV